MSVTPSAQYRLTIRVKIDEQQGMLGQVTDMIGEQGGMVVAVDLVEAGAGHSVRDIVVDAGSREHWNRILSALASLAGAEVIDTTDRTFLLHVGGKIEQHNKHPLKTRDDLSMAYTPGVARVCTAIKDDPDKAFQYTIKRNTVAVVSDGTAVLGLGDIGPAAAMPVMEGKACLFKEFAGVDAFPICLDTKDTDEIVRAVTLIAPAFGGINLEDISAPRCFEVEERLKSDLDIPVFHDDQHGTAVVVTGGAAECRQVDRPQPRGAESARDRARSSGRRRHQDPPGGRCARHRRRRLARRALDFARGLPRRQHELGQALVCRVDQQRAAHGQPGRRDRRRRPARRPLRRRALPVEALAKMNKDAMVFAMANPNPEVIPEEAAPYVRIMATGRSDYPNQINNVLCFPGIFRGALDVRARSITEQMKMVAATAIAAIVDDSELRDDYIIPSVFNRDVAPAVAAAVAEQARASGDALAGQEVGYAQGDTLTGMGEQRVHSNG